MDEVIQALRELAAQGIQTTARINALTATMTANVEAQANWPQPLPRLDATKFATLDIGTGSEASKISKLCAWEAAISFNIVSFDGMRADLPLPRLISAILGSLRDPCRQMTQGMDPTRYNPEAEANANQNRQQLLQTFFSDLSNILLGASVPEKAYALYQRRKQKADEPIHPYHAELGVLYRKAFPETWEEPENQRALIRHFLDNLYDESLAYDVNINQQLPATYPEALNLLEQRYGAWERYRLAYGPKAGPQIPGRHPAAGGHGGGGVGRGAAAAGGAG